MLAYCRVRSAFKTPQALTLNIICGCEKSFKYTLELSHDYTD